MILFEQNIVKKNRANNPKTFHQSDTPAFQQYPKENMTHVIHAMNLYNQNGYTINRKVLAIIKEMFLGGGNFRRFIFSIKDFEISLKVNFNIINEYELLKIIADFSWIF